ncbi:hypothetical protein RJT34_18412 [Clitoria ternatea]|uniref:Protein kinase domain-containing protein n=1 Tax=Clitoria ternatea TaxID=43366 RepID=A0AAN9PE91_CLITE
MGTRSRTRIALATTLFLFLSNHSKAGDIYLPIDHFSITCGSSSNFEADGRTWNGDINNKKLLSESQDSVAVTAPASPFIKGPYTSARLSYSQFTYSFPVTPGPNFLRLFFYSISYPNFDHSKAFFSVKSGPYTLLHNFNASLNADAVSQIFTNEYCINVEIGQKLNITFIPSTTDSYAFINGIEVISMPNYLYYTNPNENTALPKLVGSENQYRIENNHALENTYRIKAGGRAIPASEDTGMLRTWDSDDTYLTTQSTESGDFSPRINLTFTNETPEYTAPEQVYRTVRNMGSNGTDNMKFNITWQFPVDSGFAYLLRLHFCELDPQVNQIGDFIFYIYIADQMVADRADILLWTDGKKGVPVVRDYVVFITESQKKTNLSLKMHPHPKTLIQDAHVNAIELFKISNSSNSLAGPNPDPPLIPTEVLPKTSNKKNRGNKKTLVAVAGVASGVVLLSFIVALFLVKRGEIRGKGKGKDGTSRGSGPSSLPTNLCRHFSIGEIRAATNNFDELFVVGVGGFGNVYKGYIDDGSTSVAIKRLKPGSQQGAHEFLNEIEMLSQLRHLHLVSLIGYCYESNEMILVYDFMDRGSLRDHLYGSENPSLSWKQRLQICIGAARGLHYLHTGSKHMIIHRDVKSTNILLDEKWVAKVSDFGLSRIGPIIGTSVTHVSTQVKGSVGYLDPEYYKRQRLTEKSDVYSFGVVLLEILSGRQPLLRRVEKRQVSLVDWAKHCYQKGTLSEMVDPVLKGQIAPECLRKFGEFAVSCLLEDGALRPSMNDIAGVLEFVWQLQDNVVDRMVRVSEDSYDDSGNDVFSSSQSSRHTSDISKSSGMSSTTSYEDYSYASKESDRLMSDNVFSEIKDPKGR